MTTKTEVKNYGIGLLPVLGIVFIILKLTNVINWSWWLVLLPFIIQAGLLILALAILGIAAYIKYKKS
ncbi:TPA: hypothetical protein PNO69_004476 [Salmonella enterica]|nr:hypothetical protein [Salmonella enterica]HCH9607919.1 hypothetical protein [Salmonella enterica]HDI5000213.1 hypothetical protein [Salmonella enterica]HDI5005034.1 hypothetical protein [Salmonella enterica]